MVVVVWLFTFVLILVSSFPLLYCMVYFSSPCIFTLVSRSLSWVPWSNQLYSMVVDGMVVVMPFLVMELYVSLSLVEDSWYLVRLMVVVLPVASVMVIVLPECVSVGCSSWLSSAERVTSLVVGLKVTWSSGGMPSVMVRVDLVEVGGITFLQSCSYIYHIQKTKVHRHHKEKRRQFQCFSFHSPTCLQRLHHE
ncbi:MAG: hypothetical protein RI911_392 [Candidatus Parcubacteria bacterium]